MCTFFVGDKMNKYMEIAIKEAEKSIKKGDIPVGAVIVENDKIISKAYNTREQKNKITGHAEINAIEKVSKKKKTWHLNDCELYVTLEPCDMCKEVIKQTHIKKVYFLAPQTKKTNYKNFEMIQINSNQKYVTMLQQFFQNKRTK